MASIDKVAIGVTIVVIAIALGITASMSAAQDAGPRVSTSPTTSTEIVESEAPSSSSFGADLSAKIRAEAAATEVKTMEPEDDNMEETMMEETVEPEETMMEEATGPETHNVEVPLGTSVPGCEETDMCFSPASITVNAGDTVEWNNVDTAAHTVTGGSPSDGPSGVFDSSLLMVDASYTFTFEDTGSYDYFCMVHPWMVGSVTVN